MIPNMITISMTISNIIGSNVHMYINIMKNDK